MSRRRFVGGGQLTRKRKHIRQLLGREVVATFGPINLKQFYEESDKYVEQEIRGILSYVDNDGYYVGGVKVPLNKSKIWGYNHIKVNRNTRLNLMSDVVTRSLEGATL